MAAWNSISEPWRRAVDRKIGMGPTHRHSSLTIGRLPRERSWRDKKQNTGEILIARYERRQKRSSKRIDFQGSHERVQGNWGSPDERLPWKWSMKNLWLASSWLWGLKSTFLSLRGRKWQSWRNSFLKFGRISNVGPYLPCQGSWELGSI